MKSNLYTAEEVRGFIAQGKKMVLAGDEEILAALPAGNWIGGTTPYFMDAEKGTCTRDMIFVDDFTDIAENISIQTYPALNLRHIGNDGFFNGFTVVILPLDSPSYYEFAHNSLTYPGIYQNPVVGFVSGINVADFGKITAKAINGKTRLLSHDHAVAMHVELPPNKIARTEILGLDRIHPQAKSIVFPKTSFTQSACLIDGKPANIAEYITELREKHHLFGPLICNTNGALINRDIKHIDLSKGTVSFYSPLYESDVYYIGEVQPNYQELFNDWLNKRTQKAAYCSICITYYFQGNLENKKVNIEGAFAFGEIAFQLLNKTLVLLEIDTTN